MFPPFLQAAKCMLPTGVQNALRKSRDWSQLAWTDVRVNMLGHRFPLKPRAISMMVNDVCNSRCQMCLIWEQKKDHEITVEELRSVLNDRLFTKVRNVGVTGGEPTLRKDLPEIFRVIAQRRPRIEHASMITNAIRSKEVEERVLACANVCREYGIGFSVMVSLDGLGDVHDTVRGRAGNFTTAVACLEKFKAEGITVSFGCTITKSNVANVDELLDWAQEHSVYGRFRVAEFIDRLYNAPQKAFIRSFSELEQYHLGLFFYRAELEFESSSMVQKTYRSIRGMLAEGRRRSTGCPYHHDTVILTSRGELLYCSPKSPNLGNILEPGAASKVYFGNLSKRQEIREKHCDTCIHDYHVPVTFREKVNFYLKCRQQARRYDCRALVRQAQSIPPAPILPPSFSHTSKRVLIVGWFGTETAGDKAILASVVQRLKLRSQPPENIILASLHPFVSRHTLKELGIPELQIVETFSPEFMESCRSCDEVVVGGGPLMDLEILNHILFAFIEARRRNGLTRVEGCGIGPLSDPRFIPVVREILRLANVRTLRDKASAFRCRNEFGLSSEVVEDPAIDFVRAWMRQSPDANRNSQVDVACFLRAWGEDYRGDLSPSQFVLNRNAFELGLVNSLSSLIHKWGLRMALYPMHSFSVGGDDRNFNRRLARRMHEGRTFPAGALTVERLPMAPAEILTAMKASKLNVCMRFHSVVFAQTLGVPYIAIDYTGGGKIRAFLEERGCLDRMLLPEQVAAGEVASVVERLFPRF